MAWWQNNFGDRVKTADLERLDRPDYDAAADFASLLAGRQLGAVWGLSAGALTNVVFVPGNNGVNFWIDVGAFTFVWTFAQRGDNDQLLKDAGRLLTANPYGDGQQKGWVSYEITCDPSRAGQNVRIDITNLLIDARQDWFVTGGGTTWSLYDTAAAKQIWPFLWARPYLADAVTGQRRQWNPATGAEDSVNIPTRTQILVDLRLQYSDPTPSDGSEPPFVKIGRVLRYDFGAAFPDAFGFGPQIPILYAISAFDDESNARLLREPGTTTYQGNASNARALGPNGEITAAGLGQDGTQAQYGQAPIQGNTNNVSEFLAPYPPWQRDPASYPAQGILFGSANNTPPNPNYQASPVFLGVAGLLGIIRDRIKRLVVGAQNGSTLDDSRPWWYIPERGLVALSGLIDGLQAQMDLVYPYASRPQPVACAFVEWSPAGGNYLLTKLINCNFSSGGNNNDPSGNPEPVIGFTPALATKRIAWVEVCALPNAGYTAPNYQWGADRFGLGYNPALGGYRVIVKRIYDATTPGGAATQQEIHLHLEGPNHGAAWPAPMVTVGGSFMLVAYADPGFSP